MKILFQIVLLLSKMPLKILYIFSDFIFFVIFRIFSYRKKVVFNNIKNSFPEKSEKELNEIQKKFFINFSDYLVETIKGFSISSKELRIRVQHINQDVFYEAKKEEKNIILLAGHVFNWEWFTALATIVPQENCHPVYRNVHNKFLNEKIKLIRNSFGNKALDANSVIPHILRNKNDGNSIYMFVADQSPHPAGVNLGIQFLNQKTPVFVGYDKLATRMDFAFVYCEMKKVKRGYYQINYHRIFPDGEKFVENEVVKKFHKLLENTINKRPDNYLWSHRKWKYAHHIKNFQEN